MRMPIGWQGLRGTLGVQLAQLRMHLGRQAEVVPALTAGQKARDVKPEDGFSAEQVQRIVARRHGKWAEAAQLIANELNVSRWRVENLRKRVREASEAVCAS